MQQNSSWGNWSRQVVPANHFKGPFSHRQTEDSDTTPISANCSFLQVPLQPKMTETSCVLLNISGNTYFVHFKILFERRALSLINEFTKFANGRSTSLLRNLLRFLFLPQWHSYLNRKWLFCRFFTLHFPKQKAVNLLRPWQEEMIKCRTLVLHMGPKDLPQQWEHPVLPRNTLGTHQNSRAAPTHTCSLSASSSTSFLPSLPAHTALWSCRIPHVGFWMSQLLTQVLLPSWQAGSAQLHQELPTASWRATSGNHRLSRIERQNPGEFSPGRCCHIHQWATLKAKITADKHDLNFSSEVFV